MMSPVLLKFWSETLRRNNSGGYRFGPTHRTACHSPLELGPVTICAAVLLAIAQQSSVGFVTAILAICLFKLVSPSGFEPETY